MDRSIKYSKYTDSAKLLGSKAETEVRLLKSKLKNKEQFGKPDINFSLWKYDYIVPWNTFFDIFIVLLYVLFALTFQSTKMSNFHNFGLIFDNYFLGETDEDDDGLTYIYFKKTFIEIVQNVSQSFFTFVDSFPSQLDFERSSNLIVSLYETGKSVQYYYYSPENVTEISSIVSLAANSKHFEKLVLDVDYLIKEITSETMMTFITVKYSMIFLDVDQIGVIELRSKLKNTVTKLIGTNPVDYAFRTEIFAVGIFIVDTFALLFTISRFIVFFKNASIYSTRNYLTFYRAVLRKVDGWEIFNLFYQSLTLITILIYLCILDPNFGYQRWLLFLLGIAAFIHSFGLFRYLKMKDDLWLVARLAGRSLGQSSTLFLGFTPIYFGFVFMGIAFFGYFCNVFKGFLRTIKVLFSIFHCDIVMDTEELVKDAAVVPDWVINLYIFAWTNMTGGMIINVIISVVEVTLDSLMTERANKKNHRND